MVITIIDKIVMLDVKMCLWYFYVIILRPLSCNALDTDRHVML